MADHLQSAPECRPHTWGPYRRSRVRATRDYRPGLVATCGGCCRSRGEAHEPLAAFLYFSFQYSIRAGGLPFRSIVAHHSFLSLWWGQTSTAVVWPMATSSAT